MKYVSLLLFAFICFAPLYAVTSTERLWDDDAGDDDFWTASNWSADNRPNGNNESARFPSTLGSNYTITVSQDVTLERLIFNSPNNVTLNDGGGATEITMDSNEDTPDITFLSNTGNVTINEDIYFVDNLLIHNANQNTVNIQGGITNLGGKTLTFTGNGSTTTRIKEDVTINTAAVYVDSGATRITDAGVLFLLDGGGGTPDFYVGNSGGDIGRLEISNSAKLDIDSEFYVASDSSAKGFVTISSGADLTVDNTSRIGQRGSGVVTLTGSGSTWVQEGNNIDVGVSHNGNGLIEVKAGATLTSTNTNSIFRLGVASGKIGSLLVTGDGTRAHLDQVIVGDASGEANQFKASNTAVINVADGLHVADDAGSLGEVELRTEGKINVTGNTNIGRNGTGLADITGSGSGIFGEDMWVGKNTTGIGTMTISGGGRIVSTNLIVKNSGSVVSTVKAEVGISHNSEDDKLGVREDLIIRVDGAFNTSDTFRAGQAADETGNVTIESGGDLTVSGIGYVADQGTGTMVVTGTGSLASFNSQFYVGNAANSNGRVTILSGADLATSSSDILLGANGTGVMTVTGSGATVTSANDFFIGSESSGNGTLTIASSGKVSVVGTIYIGQNGGTAVLNLDTDDGIIDGSNMRLNGGTFNVAGDQASGGLGTLTLSSNSTIDMNSTNTINWTVINEGTWTGTLSIHSWDGTRNQAGTDGTDDRLIFTDITGFNKGTQVRFYSDDGSTFLGTGRFRDLGGGRWELVPAPEPSTWCGIGVLLTFAIWRERKRFKKYLTSRRQGYARQAEARRHSEV